MKRLLFLLSLAGFCSTVLAQNKMLSIEDALVNNRSSLAPQNLRQAQFLYGTDDYVYIKKIDGRDVWVRGHMGKAEQPFLSMEQLNAKLRAAGQDTLAAMPPVQFNKSAGWVMTMKGNKIALDPLTNKATLLVGKEVADNDIVEESTAGYVAYVKNYNLYVTGNGQTKEVTTDGSREIVYASSVHRDEFGISKGTFWSNNGKILAFYRMDQSMVKDYPIIDWSDIPAKANLIKYPMAGDSSHHVTVGVYNPATGSLVYLQTGGTYDQYLTNIAWSPDDQSIYIAVLNREQNHMKLNQYNASTGAFVKTLFEETADTYVEPLVPMLFVKNKPTQFIWQSNRDGFNHLYLYNTDGALLKQLTKGPWEVLEVKGFDEKGENLFYVSTEESPITKNLYSQNLKSGKTSRLTTGAAIHTVQASTSGKYLLDVVSDAAHPREIRLVETASGKAAPLYNAPDPLAGYALGQMNIFTINNRQGTPLYCRLYKPVGFDSTKQYPVIVYWYGGPHAQMITAGYNGGAGDYWFQYMAERGYLVFTLDPRGCDNRGRAFEQAIFRKAGEPQMEDLMSGVDYLKSLRYADTNTMGLFGWSYGGFMTIDFMLHHPGVFKAAIAGGPVTDWRMYEIMYGERYMDKPQENPEGYAATDLSRQVQNLKGKLLLIHGLQDDVVVQQHSVKFVRAAIDKGVQVDYMIYPGHTHNVVGKDRAHLYQKVTDYFMQNVK